MEAQLVRIKADGFSERSFEEREGQRGFTYSAIDVGQVYEIGLARRGKMQSGRDLGRAICFRFSGRIPTHACIDKTYPEMRVRIGRIITGVYLPHPTALIEALVGRSLFAGVEMNETFHDDLGSRKIKPATAIPAR